MNSVLKKRQAAAERTLIRVLRDALASRGISPTVDDPAGMDSDRRATATTELLGKAVAELFGVEFAMEPLPEPPTQSVPTSEPDAVAVPGELSLNDRRVKLSQLPIIELRELVQDCEELSFEELTAALHDRDRAIDVIVSHRLDIDAGIHERVPVDPMDDPRRSLYGNRSAQDLRRLIEDAVARRLVDEDELLTVRNRDDAITLILKHDLEANKGPASPQTFAQGMALAINQ